jgi:lysophospholipase L1-like esterase
MGGNNRARDATIPGLARPNDMDWYEAEVRALEEARHTHALPLHPAVFYGSSSIRLWTTLAPDLGDVAAVNLGFGGATLAACVWFFERLVLPVRPASLVVYAGDNDLGDGRPPSEVAGWFAALSFKVMRDLGDIPFFFISIKPSPARLPLLGRTVEANAAIRRAIADHPSGYYVDVFTPMLGSTGQPRTELFLDDGLHLNRAGYRLWSAILREHHDRIFTKTTGDGHTRLVRSTGDGS